MAQETDPPPNQDFISGLPEDVKVKILEYLETDEAVRSSILSKSWRYTWSNITKLDIKKSYFPSSYSLISFMDMFFLLHNGPIFEFLLNVFPFRPWIPVRGWIRILSKRNIQSLHLSVELYCPLEIPSEFYSCHALETVRLEYFEMDVPFAFDGLKLLKTLSLGYVNIDSDSLERLISNCPLLETLQIENSRNSSLKIRAPNASNIKDLVIKEGYFHELYLDVPSLVHATFATYDGKYTNLSYLLSRVPSIEKLDISLHCEKVLSSRSWENPSMKFNNLIEIAIDIYPSDHVKMSCALFLFEKAPNFQTLRAKMQRCYDEEPDVISLLESKSKVDSVFTKLTTMYVDIASLRRSGSSSELILPFLKFVITTAPVLQKLYLPKSLSEFKGMFSDKTEIVLLEEVQDSI